MVPRPADVEERRARARVAAVFFALIPIAVFVGYIVLTWIRHGR